MPFFRQLFVAAPGRDVRDIELDRLAFCLRKRAEREVEVYFPSLSARTMVYKGMLTTGQLEPFFPDLSDERFATELALVHSRFSTNTFPSWPLAHPYRLMAHNGEINTVKGNRNWMRARESQLVSDVIGGDLDRLFPTCTPDASDSASFDEVLELIHLGGRSLPHAVLMMIPEAWENHAEMDPARRAFYEFHSTFMEPWDGPACVAFTDGTLIGAVLDRNGLRPGRYWVTDDGLVVLASEAGVLDLPADKVVKRGRLQPGRMFLIDTAAGRIVSDDEVKSELAAEHPYEEWLHAGMLTPRRPARARAHHPHGRLGRPSPAHVRLHRGGAQDPPRADGPHRWRGPRLDGHRLARRGALRQAAAALRLLHPALRAGDQPAARRHPRGARHLARHGHRPRGQHARRDPGARPAGRPAVPGHRQRRARQDRPHQRRRRPARATPPTSSAAPTSSTRARPRCAPASTEICTEVSDAIARGARFVVLSDRDSDRDHAPIPSLLLTSAVHHHLIREKTRNMVGLLVEAGDVREVHHVALLVGYGAAAINPYLAMETVEDMVRTGAITGVTAEQAVKNLIKALGKGILKVMSKMGISTVASYRGAQVFEALGLSQELVDEYFTGTVSPARRDRPRRHRRGDRGPARLGLPAATA